MTLRLEPTVDDYVNAFEAERKNAYPAIDAIEARYGYAVEPSRLSLAARTLACPVKKNPPNWQHGRVLYAAASSYLRGNESDSVTFLDIGTAKGFSALCLLWALDDQGRQGRVISVDVLDPNGKERRNSIAEVASPKTLAEILGPWPEARRIGFLKSTGVEWLERYDHRVNFAFVDGKHKAEVVLDEGKLLASRQLPGDVAIFDDVQIEGVGRAVETLGKVYYDVEIIEVNDIRRHAIGVRRG